MTSTELFTYHWHDISTEDECIIRTYGLDDKGRTICVNITGFTPYAYLELDSSVKWDSFKIQNLLKKLGQGIISYKLVNKKKLFFNHRLKSQDGEWKDEKFQFLFLTFKAKKYIHFLNASIKRGITIAGVAVNVKLHEQNATPILQLVCNRNIKTAGWIKITGTELLEDDKYTFAYKEYNVKHTHIKPIEKNNMPEPIIMGFDIEVYSSNPDRMPDSDIPEDKVFQISAVVSRHNESSGNNVKRYLLTLGEPDPKHVGKDIEIWCRNSEGDLLSDFADLIKETQPNIITGYNIFNFDIPYMIARAKRSNCYHEFNQQGFDIDGHSPEKEINWSSSAYGNQEFKYLDAQGRLYVDLLPLVKRDYSFNNYKLKTISTYFLGETKDPLTVKGIFKSYDMGMAASREYEKKCDGKQFDKEIIIEGRKALGVCGKYCVKDSELTIKLFEKMKTWVGLAEMAAVTNVPIFYLYTQGQQVKVFSQMYKMCLEEGMVVEKDGCVAKDDERYTGALVFEPVPGAYDNVVSLDWSSLYPSVIIAYNLCFSTLIKEEMNGHLIKDEDCHVFSWTDHIGCQCDKTVRKTKIKESDIYCKSHKYRFLKSDNYEGVMPRMLKFLLSARKKTKDEMKQIKKEMAKEVNEKKVQELSSLYDVLDKRQLAYKISANSAYGGFGTRKTQYLSCLPAAMCTTYMGRETNRKASEMVQKEYGADLIYGDTDSVYIRFPQFDGKPEKELWDHSIKVAQEISKQFREPLKMEFEDAIYKRYLIFSKKRYVATKCDRNGVISNDLTIRGIILKRRDNSNVVRELYRQVIMDVFYKKSKQEVIDLILDYLHEICVGKKSLSEFIITKSVKSTLEYKSRELPTDPEKRKKRLSDLGCKNEQDYFLKSLPANIQLAEKMRRRGKIVSNGQRIEYVITDHRNPLGNLFDKLEDPEHLIEFPDVVRLDYLYYIKLMTTPLDECLEVGFGIKDFMTKQYKLHLLKWKVNREIEDLFRPRIKLIL